MALGSPAYIRNLAEFQRVVRLGATVESLVLEFKARIDWQPSKGTPDTQKRLTSKEFVRDVAQFANAFGGCLLIGIAEREVAPGDPFKVATHVEDIADPQGMIQWCEGTIKRFLLPSTLALFMDPMVFPDGKKVVAINVPPSRHAVSLWDEKNHTIEYVTRTNQGKTWLNPDEVERQLMNGASRFGKIAIAEVAASGPSVELASGVWWRTGDGAPPAPLEVGNIALGALEDSVFELRIPVAGVGSVSVKVPYSLVREAWVLSLGQVGILLDARIVSANGRVFLEPF